MTRRPRLIIAASVLFLAGAFAVIYGSRPGPSRTASLYAGYYDQAKICSSIPCPQRVPLDGDKLRAVYEAIGGLAVDPRSGDLYLTDRGAAEIRVIRASGTTETLAGTPYPQDRCELRDGVHGNARFCIPSGIAFDDRQRVLYVADYGNAAIRRVTLDGRVTTLIGTPYEPNPYHYNINCVVRGGSPKESRLCLPDGIAVNDRSGEVYVTDSVYNQVISVSPSGSARILAGEHRQCGTTDGSQTTAKFCEPHALAWDSRTDSVIVADTTNDRIREIAKDGRVSTIAGMSYSAVVDQAPRDTVNGGCRDFNGIGPFSAFCYPSGVAVDPRSSDIYIADRLNAEIRRVSNGHTQTIAGRYRWLNGLDGFYCHETSLVETGDICPPESLAFDSLRRVLYFSDRAGGQVWRLEGL
jgi:sugar lactone lactonase YvrE